MILLAAKPVVEKRRAELQSKTAELRNALGRPPHLSVILIGEDPASQVYVGRKSSAAIRAGFTSETIGFPKNVSPETVHQKVRELNADPRVDGVLIQRPLPPQMKEKDVALWVDPSKDVDCLHPENIGLLVTGNPRFIPCTPGGIILLLDHYGIPIEGKTVCVIGRSAIVGKPLASMLLSRNASLIQVHRRTPDPAALCRLGDLVFVAAGARGLLKREWLKPGSVVVDVGIHRGMDGRISGDVDTESIAGVPRALTPVPGGVGPMTIQVLLENTFAAASRRS
ncbi:MAG: bifunctional 5,10-methylenetetrahydrofolate dehydrogenase/5,10-methenyltetrahydrofolate cyclohydrolase [Bdellovibrionales bacterium]|nr:bifunctional 5,10-methylenetetrahydrofolate dehydrogenase/5,10-methenyltetrahydrofolate cyclohydrolase [Bdellovibrionales bacterium]